MVFDCSAGASFRLSGHLHVVIIDSFKSLDDVIITFLTSKKSHTDNTVILTSADHKFITHETVVNYAAIRPMKREDIIVRVKDGLFTAQDRFSDEVIRRIQYGLLTSPRTPRDIKESYAAYLNSQRRVR